MIRFRSLAPFAAVAVAAAACDEPLPVEPFEDEAADPPAHVMGAPGVSDAAASLHIQGRGAKVVGPEDGNAIEENGADDDGLQVDEEGGDGGLIRPIRVVFENNADDDINSEVEIVTIP